MTLNRDPLLLALLTIVACTPVPIPVPPPQPDADATVPIPVVDASPLPVDATSDAQPVFPPSLCGDACKSLYVLGCPQNSPNGTPCSDWLCGLPSYAALPTAALKCMAAATTKAAAKKCGVGCQ